MKVILILFLDSLHSFDDNDKIKTTGLKITQNNLYLKSPSSQWDGNENYESYGIEIKKKVFSSSAISSSPYETEKHFSKVKKSSCFVEYKEDLTTKNKI